MKRLFIIECIVVLISILGIIPLFHNGWYPMHDDTQPSRVITMGRALQHGQLPVRIVSDLGYGYGYPIYNFYGPLPYYFGGFLYAAGLSVIMSTKAMIILGVLLAPVTCALVLYLMSSSIFVAVIGGILYMYAPYHAVQLYVRGAIGELWAYGLLPLAIIPIVLSFRKDDRELSSRLRMLSIVGTSFVILSHTIMGYAVSGMLLIYGCVYTIRHSFRSKSVLRYWIQVAFALFLTMFFWLPAMTESRYTSVSGQIGSTANYHDHYVCLPQLWDSPWGFGGSTAGCIDGMSFKLGKIHIALALIGLTYFLYKRKKLESIEGFSIFVCIVSIFLMTPISTLLWDMIPGISYIQYPWRFLTFTSLGLSILGSYIFSHKSLTVRCIGVLAGIGIVILNLKLFIPQYTYSIDNNRLESQKDIRFRVSKISDEYLSPDFTRPTNIEEIPASLVSSTQGIRTDIEINLETYKKIHVLADENGTMRLAIAHFPGWEYKIDGKALIPKKEGGVPQLNIVKGEHIIEATFRDTLPRVIGNIISSITVFIYIYRYGKKKTIA